MFYLLNPWLFHGGTKTPKSEVKKIVLTCGSVGDSACELGSDNSYMTVDTNPLDIEYYSVASAFTLIKSTNSKLGFSEALYARMESTRALDGTQTEENENAKVSWTFHPDKGLRVIYEKKVD